MGVYIREVAYNDKEAFIAAVQRSKDLHYPWVKAPSTSEEFDEYFTRFQQINQKSFLVCDGSGNIAGVFNISEIVRGPFQNAYLGFLAMADYAGKNYMNEGLKLVLATVFGEMELHRIEANIQPENIRSIQLVKKNGFRYEGYSPRYLKINDVWRGMEHWAITAEDFMVDDPHVLKKDNIDVVSYDEAWPGMAQDEINKLKSVIPARNILDIQHVGSTAIPGLSSKPIIDIQIAVTSLDDMKLYGVPLLQKIGYEYWDANPDPNRMFFVKGMPPYGEKRTHHVHIVELDSDHWKNKLVFRDYLRNHSDVAKEYEQLKFLLAKEHGYDREKYTEAKSEFINRILQLAKNK